MYCCFILCFRILPFIIEKQYGATTSALIIHTLYNIFAKFEQQSRATENRCY